MKAMRKKLRENFDTPSVHYEKWDSDECFESTLDSDGAQLCLANKCLAEAGRERERKMKRETRRTRNERRGLKNRKSGRRKGHRFLSEED